MSDGTSAAPAVLELDDVAFSYGGGSPLFSGLQLEVEAGKSVAVMGPSGAGKSSLLQVMSGLVRPTSGEVRLGGSKFSKLMSGRRADVRLRRIGLVFQFGELVPELTVNENVELAGLFLGLNRADAGAAAHRALLDLDVADLGLRFPNQISGGQQQRVSIARALVNEPDLLLADEPTGSLDEDNASRVLDLLVDLPRMRGAAVVVVTHSRAVAQRCDVQLELRDGSLMPVEAFA